MLLLLDYGFHHTDVFLVQEFYELYCYNLLYDLETSLTINKEGRKKQSY